MSFYIGIDIGGMSIKAGIVNEEGRILKKSTCTTRSNESYEVIVKDIVDLCDDVLNGYKLKRSDIKGVGIGCPGTVDSGKGIITFAANLNFKNVDIITEFKKHWDVKCAVNNDANCAAFGETKFGKDKGITDALFVTLGTGIGTGFIINGKIFEGENGAGAEGGHICINMNGKKCSCGEKGCWEAYASATALLAQTEAAIARHPESLMNKLVSEQGLSGKVPFEAYKEGDKTAKRVVKQYVKYIAVGIVNFINVFRPQVVIVGGGVSNAGEYFIKMIEDEVKLHVFGGSVNKTPHIIKAVLGNDAGIIGAAAAIME